MVEKLTEKEYEHLYELVSEAWYYKRSEKILTFKEQEQLYIKLRVMKKEDLK
jgi:hypothetical protein